MLLSSTALAQKGGSVYVFGDSLSDDGNIPKYLGGFVYPGPPYYDAHFSNGPVYAEYLPGLIGAGFSPANDYAVGGAKAGTGNIDETILPSLSVTGVATQIADATAAGLRFTPQDTVLLWAGANNYFGILGGLAAGTLITDPTVQADIAQVSGFVDSDAASLIGLGARRLVVMNLPDLGATPSETQAGVSVLATDISQANNVLLQRQLLALHDQTGVNIYLVNAQMAVEEILADPGRYGILNTTQGCALVTACANAPLAVQDTYLFWDGVHPTTGVHDILAHVIANQLTAESDVGGQGELMLLQGQYFTSSLAQRLDAQRAGAAGDAPVNFYVQGSYATGNRDGANASQGFNYNTGSTLGGADLRLAPGLIVGAAFGYGQPNAHFEDGDSLAMNAYQGGVYASYFGPSFYVDATGAYSRYEGRTATRPGFLAGDVLSFSPQGHGFSGGLSGGYILHDQSLSWGPIAGVTYVDARVHQYTESGEPLVIQTVDAQEAKSLLGHAGFEATIDTTAGGFSFKPHVSLQGDREFMDGARYVDTSFVSAGLPLATKLAGYGATFGVIDAGIASDLTSALSAQVDVQTTFGRGNGDDHSVLLKLDLAL
jgi:outer membrane lipase/esterase